MNRVLFAQADYPDPDPSNPNIVLFDLQAAGNPVDAGTHGPDTATGGGDTDVMFGQGDDDTLEGNDAPDYIEGNDGNDTIRGGEGDDDLIGGGSANDGIIDEERDGETLHDEGETLIEGNAGVDWIMGDNAFSNRVLFADTDEPIDLFDVNSADTDVSGGDLISGGTEDDLIFGQGNGAQPVEGQAGAQSDPAGDGVDNDGDGVVDEDGLHEAGWLGDTILGDEGADYIEGNHGADFILGGSGPDDIAGGGSAIDGVIDDDRLGNGLLDGRDTIWGGTEDDVIGGDNVRILDGATDDGPLWLTNARDVLLFDINSGDKTVSGGDFIGGEDGADVMFGQGNGLQSADQADPLDGFDNDLDGRESAESVEYDCFDGFDNDEDGDGVDVDGAGIGAPDPDCEAGVDEDMPWDGDVIWGGDGDDYAEGNHGADWMFGDNGQDDLIGGGSAADGHITADRTPADLVDGSDVINGDDGLGNASSIGTGGDSDVIAADNARINRVDGGGLWELIPNATSGHDLVDRDVEMVEDPAPPSDFGDDHVRGDVKHDQIYGQQGDDLLEGNHGDDGIIGDLGKFVTSISTGPAQHIEPEAPFVQDDIFAESTLNHLTTLFSQETGDGSEGDDIVLGGQGHDDLHGGPGDDVMNGDLFAEFGTLPDPDLIEIVEGEFTHDEPGVGVLPYGNEDAVFGGWGDDVLWGGRDPDHLYGGHGNDYIDVRPRPAGLVPGSPRDPAAWFTWVRDYDAGTGTYTEEHYQDADVALGGWGQDVLQANLADPGPNLGDRLFDSYGAHNLFYICDPHYGSYTAIRQMSPGQRQFFIDLSSGDGLDDPGGNNTSGFSELALVYPKDAKHNTNPPHPETPGHFYCGPVAP